MFATASEKRLAANRANAQKSTGPRTEEGKAASRKNSLRHGLTAKTVVLDSEDPAEYAAFRDRVIDSFAPAEGAEQLLTEQLADALWRLKRAQRIESSALNHYLDGLKRGIYPDDPEARERLANEIGLGIVIGEENAETFRKLCRYLGEAERFYLRLQGQLLKLQAERRRNGFVSSAAIQAVKTGQVVPENGRRVRTVHADPFQNGTLLGEDTLDPAAGEERRVGTE